MATIEQIERGIEYVESHLDEEFSLAQVATAARMSQWHFQRVFKALTHDTLKSYIRARRMAVSLRRLLGTKTRIIEIAMAAGFESQETFTRAFRQAFDMTPAQFRKVGQRNQFFTKLELTSEYLRSVALTEGPVPTIHTIGPLTVAGVTTEFYGEGSEKNNLAEKLVELWDGFLPRMSEINCGALARVGYGVIEQTLDEDKLLYTAAGTLAPEAATPPRMVRRELSEGEYAVFEHRGPVRELDHTVSYAYSTWLLNSGRKHSGGADLEIYGNEYHPTSHDSVISYAMPLG